VPLPLHLRHPPALDEIEPPSLFRRYLWRFRQRGSVMPAANTVAAASFTASVEIFGEKDTAGARWIAGDFTKYAPTEALIEPRCLEADRVKNTRPAATPTRFFLRQPHHASTDIMTP
jgi:hypothetical protein